MWLIDTHCHLNDYEAFPDPSKVIKHADDVDVKELIVIGIDAETNERAVDLAEKFENVFAVVGWHPNYAKSWKSSYLKTLEAFYSHQKVCAIGEIGLDFHWDYATTNEQVKCLNDQLDLAETLDSSIVIHCRDAYPDLLSVLETRKHLRYLFHCFSGNKEDAERCMKLDVYYGVDGPITYKKNDALREIVGLLPKNRLLLETDSPWLTPTPYRGKQNFPEYLVYINNKIAEIWQCSPESSARICSENTYRFFPKMKSEIR